METAVIYARFSCSKQREASIDDQLRECAEWCSKNNVAVVGTYTDYAISGKTDDRPEFQRMIANAGESDMVVVYMMDRFSRDQYDAPIYKKKLRDAGVRVVSATEAMPDGPEALLLEKIYEGMAALESAHISQRTARGMHGNALKRLHNGVRVFGYRVADDGTYREDPEEAAIVREIFNRRASFESTNSIAADLAKRGVKTYAGNPCSYTMVYNILRNEKYLGTYIFGDVRIEGGMPQIVGRELFDMANNAPKFKNRAHEEWGDYALSGRVICAGCGRTMAGSSARGRNGQRYEYYRCGGKCVKGIRCDWLESEIVNAVRGILGDRSKALELAEAVSSSLRDSDSETRIEAARKRQKAAEDGIRNLTDAVAAGFDFQEASKKISELKIQFGAAEAEIAMLGNQARFDVEDFADFLQFGATLDDATLLSAFVHQAMVDDDFVAVRLNYDINDKPAEISLQRVCRNCNWLPTGKSAQTQFCVSSGTLLVRFKRAA